MRVGCGSAESETASDWRVAGLVGFRCWQLSALPLPAFATCAAAFPAAVAVAGPLPIAVLATAELVLLY